MSSSDENTIIKDSDPLIQKESINESSLHSSGELYAPRHMKSLTEVRHRASTFRTFVNITKCFVGAASLELPWAFMEAGWLFAMFGLIVLALMSYYTLVQISRCGHLATRLSPKDISPTYPEIGKIAFGKVGMIAAYFGIFVMTLGLVGSYFVFIGTSLSSILCPLSPVLTPSVMTAIMLPVIILLSWLRAYRFLAPTSIFGVLALILGVTIVLVDGFRNYTIQPMENYPKVNWSTIPLFLGNASFLYLIHSVILPTEQSMQKREKYPLVVGLSVGSVTVVNVVFSLLAYFLFASDTKGNVIENLTEGPLKIVVKVSLTIDLIATSVLFLLPAFELFERGIWDVAEFGTRKVEILRNVLRTVVCGAAAGIALLIPCFSLITGLAGGFGNCICGLILPPLFYMRLSYKLNHYKAYKLNRQRIFHLIMSLLALLLGIAIFTLSTTFVIREVIVNGCGNTTDYCAFRAD